MTCFILVNPFSGSWRPNDHLSWGFNSLLFLSSILAEINWVKELKRLEYNWTNRFMFKTLKFKFLYQYINSLLLMTLIFFSFWAWISYKYYQNKYHDISFLICLFWYDLLNTYYFHSPLLPCSLQPPPGFSTEGIASAVLSRHSPRDWTADYAISIKNNQTTKQLNNLFGPIRSK